MLPLRANRLTFNCKTSFLSLSSLYFSRRYCSFPKTFFLKKQAQSNLFIIQRVDIILSLMWIYFFSFHFKNLTQAIKIFVKKGNVNAGYDTLIIALLRLRERRIVNEKKNENQLEFFLSNYHKKINEKIFTV